MGSIYDVAKTAGVSTATVSRVINKKANVSPRTRAKVLKAIETLNYTPSSLVRAFITKKNHSVGLIIPDITNPFYPPLIKGIIDFLKTQNYRLTICNTDGDLELEIEYLTMLLRQEVDGMIIYGHDIRSKWLSVVQKTKRPIVYMGTKVDDPSVETIETDEFFGAYEAVTYLIERGHKRIGYFGGWNYLLANVHRFEAYKQALKDSGLPLDLTLVRSGDFSFESGRVFTISLFQKPPFPTAIFSCSDLVAAGALQAAHEMGIKVPDELAIVGYDDIPLAVVTHPPLTTVAQPKYELGRLAAECVIDYIRNPDSYKKKELRLPTRLIKRQSA